MILSSFADVARAASQTTTSVCDRSQEKERSAQIKLIRRLRSASSFKGSPEQFVNVQKKIDKLSGQLKKAHDASIKAHCRIPKLPVTNVAEVDGENILQNPGFETDTAWVGLKSDSFSAEALAGNRALLQKIEAKSISQNVGILTPNSRTYSIYAQCSNEAQPFVLIGFFSRLVKGNSIDSKYLTEIKILKSKNEIRGTWNLFEDVFDNPENAYVKLFIGAVGNAGACKFDEAWITHFSDIVTATATATSAPTSTPLVPPTSTMTPGVTPAASPTVTSTVTVTRTRTITPTPSRTPTPSTTPTPGSTPTPSRTMTPTPTGASTATPTRTTTPTMTRTPIPTSTPGGSPGDCTYFVDPNGNDSNVGSLAAPWRTVGKANSTAHAGNTVCFRAGTYDEGISPQFSGLGGQPITFKNYNGEAAVLSGMERGLELSNRNYITIRGLQIDNTGWMEANSSSHLIIDQNTFTRSTSSGTTGNIRLVSSTYNQITNNTVDGGTDNIVIIDSNYNLIAYNHVTEGSHSLLSVRCSDFNIIRGNYLYNQIQKAAEIYDCGVDTSAVPHQFDSTKRNIFEGNIFAYTRSSTRSYDYNGIQFSPQQTIVRRNVFYDNMGGGLDFQVYGDEALYNYQNRAYNNTFYNNHCYGLGGSDDPEGPQFGDNQVKNNLLYANVNCSGGAVQTNVSNPAALILTNNAILTSDPLFVNAAARDLRLQSNSPMINAASYLTTTNGSGSGTVITLADVLYFSDGLGIPGEQGDLIQIFGTSQTARIVSIDYNNRQLQLDTALTWQNGQGVTLAYQGSAPDMGAFEAQ